MHTPVDCLPNDDNTWGIALDTIKMCLNIPPTLPQLIRSCWSGFSSPDDLLHTVSVNGLSPHSLVRAAQISDDTAPPSRRDLQEAIDILGVKASSIVLAVNCICEQVLRSAPPVRLWAPMFKEMMSGIEIGYHFGSSIDRVGIEQGMLVGFSRLAGLSILLLTDHQRFEEWQGHTGGSWSQVETINAFGCEPYQVSSILIQQLGLGIEFSLATAASLGNFDESIIGMKPSIETWVATHHWIEALRSGSDLPVNPTAQGAFPELVAPSHDSHIPSHIAALKEQVTEIRAGHSHWTWHLPLPTYEETAKAMVYKRNKNATGPSWSRSLEA